MWDMKSLLMPWRDNGFFAAIVLTAIFWLGADSLRKHGDITISDTFSSHGINLIHLIKAQLTSIICHGVALLNGLYCLIRGRRDDACGWFMAMFIVAIISEILFYMVY
jgi:hypothetical protein